MKSKNSEGKKTSAEESQQDAAANLRSSFAVFVADYNEFRSGHTEGFPDSLFQACRRLAADIVGCQHFPDDLRKCVSQLAAFAEGWLDFMKSEAEQPSANFFMHCDQMIESAERQPRQLEPVSKLLEDLKDFEGKYDQIARMYGRYDEDLDRYDGPFYTLRGTPNPWRIEEEGRNPGRIVPAGWHPQAGKMAASQAAALEKIQDLAKQYTQYSRQDAGQPVCDPASVDQLLTEGAFINQIVAAKRVSEAHVRDRAKQLGIIVKSADEILNAKGEELWSEKQSAEDGAYLDAMTEVNG